jgi:hypothetical protein
MFGIEMEIMLSWRCGHSQPAGGKSFLKVPVHPISVCGERKLKRMDASS